MRMKILGGGAASALVAGAGVAQGRGGGAGGWRGGGVAARRSWMRRDAAVASEARAQRGGELAWPVGRGGARRLPDHGAADGTEPDIRDDIGADALGAVLGELGLEVRRAVAVDPQEDGGNPLHGPGGVGTF